MTNLVAAQLRVERRSRKTGVFMRWLKFLKGLPVVPRLHLGPIVGAGLLAMIVAFGDRRQLAMAYILAASLVGFLYVVQGIRRVRRGEPAFPLRSRRRRC